MCGIIGYSGKKPINQIDLKLMLHLARDRGEDSCGIATPKTIFKNDDDPLDFIRQNLPIHKQLIGHTRGASVGTVNAENAHPFKNGDLVGVHNGRIRNFERIQNDEDTDFEVDSQIIWHVLNKYGYPDGFPKLAGFMALAWFDEDGVLNLYRHNTEALYIGYKDQGLYFGSQKRYLSSIDCDDIQRIQEHTVYSIIDGEIVAQVTFDDNDQIPGYYVATKKGGQNTQLSHKREWNSGGENSSIHNGGEYYPKNQSVPSDAGFILGNDGIGYYYWIGMNTNELFVQPSSPSMEYPSKIEKFHFHSAKDVRRLVDSFPDVYHIKRVNTKIPADLQ